MKITYFYTGIKYILALLFIVAIASCANRGMPDGGLKDEDPPVITRSVPENFSTNFKSKEVKIYFDEYVKLKDLRKQLIVSPPMDPEPIITPMGAASKYITIKLPDTLLANTTYAINFGNSIVDNNEENPYPYYRYVFSTGSYIDSLTVTGSVMDSEKRITDKFISVMLYEVDSTYTDSVIYKQKPRYITNTLDSVTTFKIENIKAGTYKMVALKEQTSNFTFQPKTDKIGFVEGFITVPKDTSYVLKMFKEVIDFKVLRPKQVAEQRIQFPFEGDYKGAQVTLLDTLPTDFDFKISKDAKADTLYYWYKPKLELDSTLFLVRKGIYADTLKHKFFKADTDSLTVTGNPSGTLDFGKQFSLEGSIPLVSLDESLISIMNRDSVNVPFTTQLDTLWHKFVFDFQTEERQQYKIRILPEAIKDFYGNTTDTLNFSLNTKQKSDYGNIRVNLVNAKLPLIVQLVDDKDEVKYERYANTNNFVDFFDVAPRNYYLRAIFDTNQNGRYDTGSFLNNFQPERISYRQEEAEVRANFDYVLEFVFLE